MNKLIIAILFCVALTAFARSPRKFEDTKTVLAEIDKDPFGNAMISAI
jgi:hypothetical protein